MTYSRDFLSKIEKHHVEQRKTAKTTTKTTKTTTRIQYIVAIFAAVKNLFRLFLQDPFFFYEKCVQLYKG